MAMLRLDLFMQRFWNLVFRRSGWVRFARNLALRLGITATISKTRCHSSISFYKLTASEFR